MLEQPQLRQHLLHMRTTRSGIVPPGQVSMDRLASLVLSALDQPASDAMAAVWSSWPEMHAMWWREVSFKETEPNRPAHGIWAAGISV